MAWHEIIIPYDLYTSKVLEDVGLLITPTSFKSRNMKKIDSNIEIINKMLFEDHRDVDYIAIGWEFHQKSLLNQWENIRSG